MSLDLTTMCMSTNKESTKSIHRETRLLRVEMKRAIRFEVEGDIQYYFEIYKKI